MTRPRTGAAKSAGRALGFLLLTSCGYRAVYGGGARERLHVKLVRTQIPDAIASEEVTAGLRETLARAGALEGGDGFPRVELEVIRTDDASEGIAAGPSVPLARAIGVGIAARAWIVRAPGAEPENDTGDMRAEETLTVDVVAGIPDPRTSAFHQADALRAAARRLGQRLAYKVSGEPATNVDGSEDR